MGCRRLKVYRRPGLAGNNTVPEMRIGGAWLTRLGFKVGDHVRLAVENGRIVIGLEEIPDMAEEAPEGKMPE